MPRPWTLAAKLSATGLAFLLLALASIGLTLWVTWNLEGGAAAINETGRLRMQAYRLALSLPQGNAARSRELADAFDASLELVHAGDPSRPLFVPWTADTRARFGQVRSEWQALAPRWLGAPGDGAIPAQADAFVGRIDGLVGAIEAEMSRWTAILRAFQLAMVALAIASAVVLLYAGHALVLNPLARLRRGLAAVQQGEFATRIAPCGPDEFGDLAAGFNAMAGALQSLYDTLEEKVREKTQRLEGKRQRLADLYEVSAFVAEAPTVEALARGFAGMVRRIGRADAAVVRWCDEGHRRYPMLAQDGLPPAFAAAEACLEAGACHCGGAAEQAAATRVIPLAAPAPPPLGHCLRAGFATVVCIPVRLHERVLAEVDLFYRAPAELDAEERGLLDALASHLAGAMEGLRAAAMEREAAVAEERALLARELHDSIAQSLAFMKIQVQLLRQATERGDTAALRRVLDELDTGVRESYADVRELLLHFRTRASDGDIEPALRATLQKFEHQTGVTTELHVEGHGVPLPADVQVQVLHIVQEALSNVRRHADATHVVLRAGATPHWRFEIRDDGAGFDPGDAPGPTHVGLHIMRERAERIGARVELRSLPGAGCGVVLDLAPAREPAEA